MPKPLAEITRSYQGPRPPVSVVILTLDEEINIDAAIASCSWCDDIHVLDSVSTDRTAELARAAGASVHVNRFESFGRQRNWAIDHIPLRHDWVFHLDADERFTPELVREIDEVLRTSPNHAGYYVANQMILNATWIKRSSGYPAYQVRLFHKSRMRFSDHGHGQREETSGTLGTLRSPYVHHNFSKGLDDWKRRHEKYSEQEARQIIAAEQRGENPSLAALFSSDAVARRRALKAIAARLPMRASIRWLHTVLLKGAILDGAAGLRYANLLYWYERRIAQKARAMRANSKEPAAP
jgi:glycosyltransferase involved in cell wall biosynthesis